MLGIALRCGLCPLRRPGSGRHHRGRFHGKDRVPRTVVLTLSFAVGAAIPLLIFALAGRRVAERVETTFRRHQKGMRIVGGALVDRAGRAGLLFNLPAAIQRLVPDYTVRLQNQIAENNQVKQALGLGGLVDDRTRTWTSAATTPRNWSPAERPPISRGSRNGSFPGDKELTSRNCAARSSSWISGPIPASIANARFRTSLRWTRPTGRPDCRSSASTRRNTRLRRCLQTSRRVPRTLASSTPWPSTTSFPPGRTTAIATGPPTT